MVVVRHDNGLSSNSYGVIVISIGNSRDVVDGIPNDVQLGDSGGVFLWRLDGQSGFHFD
jgi:hypothetical protein